MVVGMFTAWLTHHNKGESLSVCVSNYETFGVNIIKPYLKSLAFVAI